jgi:hypothetical protein
MKVTTAANASRITIGKQDPPQDGSPSSPCHPAGTAIGRITHIKPTPQSQHAAVHDRITDEDGHQPTVT